MSKKTLLALGASGVLALGIAAAPAVAYAADNDRSTTTQSEHRRGQFGADQQKLAAGLAKELGLDESKVSDALTKVREQLRSEAKANAESKDDSARPDGTDRAAALKERLAAAVKEGKLTQAEADAIIKATEAGVLGGGPRGGGPKNDDPKSATPTP
jgi:hypothetical protein